MDITEAIVQIMAFKNNMQDIMPVLMENKIKAFKIALEALDKQVPREPTNFSGRHWGEAIGGNCPVCNSAVNSKEYRYCRNCGQALDWGRKNDK